MRITYRVIIGVEGYNDETCEIEEEVDVIGDITEFPTITEAESFGNELAELGTALAKARGNSLIDPRVEGHTATKPA